MKCKLISRSNYTAEIMSYKDIGKIYEVETYDERITVIIDDSGERKYVSTKDLKILDQKNK